MTPRVVLRARSGRDVGLGHVMRSRSIAQEVSRAGGEPLLVVDDEATAAHLAGEPFEVVLADEARDWCDRAATGAWVDGFVDWTPVLARLRAVGTPSFLAENRGPAREHADRVVYPALHWRPDDWDRAHAERVLAGAAWIPLAREVRGVRPSSERDVDLIVTFGGSDPFELTERALSALDLERLRVVVAVGPHMAARGAALEAATQRLPGVRVLEPGTPLARWFARARAALTAVGTTLYELAFLGVPALVLANYEQDREALAWYDQHGPHLPLGVAAELSQEGLRATLTAGLGELGRRPPPAVPELGGGARRLAQALLAA